MKEGEANVNRIVLKSTITHKGGYLMNKKYSKIYIIFLKLYMSF